MRDDRGITVWEGAAERIFGFSAEEAFGFLPEQLPIAEPDVARRLREILLAEPEVPLEHDLHLLRKDGTTFPARLPLDPRLRRRRRADRLAAR